MKKRTRWFLLVTVVGLSAIGLSGAVAAIEKSVSSRNVVFPKSGGVVLTGTELSKADEAAMNKILNRYDKALYRIDTYENGARKKSVGKLTNIVTDKKLASEIAANTKKPGFTHFAVQICSTTNPVSTTGAGANPARTDPASTTNPASGASSAQGPRCPELIDRLKPILEKYRRN